MKAVWPTFAVIILIFTLFLDRHILKQKGFSLPRSLRVGHQTILTESHSSVLSEWSERWWTSDSSAGSSFQWYVQLSEGVSVHDIKQSCGASLTLYFPDDGYLFVGSQNSAKALARSPGVAWVGRRSETHKVAINVFLTDEITPSYFRRWLQWSEAAATSDSRDAVDGMPIIISVVLIPMENRCDLQDSGCRIKLKDIPIKSEEIVQSWLRTWEDMGIAVEAQALSDTKAYLRSASKTQLARASSWLSRRPEVFWLEKRSTFGPLNFQSQRLLVNGPDLESEENQNDELWSTKLGLDGTGQIIGIADTGIDMDNCFFWESAQNPSFPERGLSPLDPNRVDLSRRKIVAYTYDDNCSLCASCPVEIPDDTLDLSVFTLQARTSNYELLAVKQKSFPADPALASLPPRLYSSSGATLRLELKAVTQGCPSTYCGTGAGAFDLESDVQILIYGSSVASQAIPSRPELLIDQCIQTPAFCEEQFQDSDPQCICKQKANTFNWEVQLPGSAGGYTIFIVNAGAGNNPVNIKLEGKIRFLTARKPCGDFGDDRVGHGTHVVGVTAGSASTSALNALQMQSASQFNGIASGAKVYFTDVMYNADPSCNIPEKICDRVGEMTLPVDLKTHLFPGPYSAGARIHLNAWGCRLVKGERGEVCNNYTSDSMEVDSFVWENQDLLVIFAAGDFGDRAEEGTVTSPGTCKNCVTVGATNSWNSEYRHSVRYRDPLEDICAACQFPQFCSRSSTISGQFVQNSSVRDTLIGALDPCCNDTFQLPVFSVSKKLLPKGQMWTTLFPRGMPASAIRGFVVRTLGWNSRGTSAEYNVVAEPCTSASGGCGKFPPKIQMFFLTGTDYGSYFQDLATRPDPCITVHAGQYPTQALGDPDPCLQGPQMAGCQISPCQSTSSIQCIDPYCFQGTCQTTDSRQWTSGCPAGITCCDDNFLLQACMNQPCATTSDAFKGIFRTPKTTTVLSGLAAGFGVVIRNVGETDVLLSVNFSFHEREYPCTLADCCAEAKQSPLFSDRPIFPSSCCSDNYTGTAGTITACKTCPTNAQPGECLAYDQENLVVTSSRGPAMQEYITNRGEKRYKPDLVAPGYSVVGANSDGNINTNGPADEYWVQCGLPTSFTSAGEGCTLTSSGAYDRSAAVITKSGTSAAASFIAGAAAVVRQYLVDGWYPRGISNTSNKVYANPSAALLKAMLINSARSIAGKVVTYAYELEPESAKCADCPVWIQPPPNVSEIKLKSSYQNTKPPPTPNYHEGFGRPVLKNILWTASAKNSSYSLYLRENSFDKEGLMHTYTFPVANPKGANPFGLQLKVTMAYTDPPSTPGADSSLVNDLNLVVQKVVTSLVWDVNKADNVTQRSFVSTYGNSGGSTPDSANTVEEVILYVGNTEPELVNITVVIVARKLASSYLKLQPQRYALVVSGVLMTKIHYWRQIRDGILAISGSTGDGALEDDGIRKAFAVIDFMQRGFFTAENIWMRWNLIGLPSQDQTLANNLASEADVENNGAVNLLEFTEIVYLLRIDSMQPREPIFAELPADPTFMGQKSGQTQVYYTSGGILKSPKIFSIILCFVVCFLFSRRR